MKKAVLITFAVVLILSMAACGKHEKNSSEAVESNSVQIANPFVDCKTLDDAATIAGFSLAAPSSIPNWVSETKIRAIENNMIELIYSGTEQQLRVRKANGNDDISGQYDSFDEVTEITVDNLAVTIKRNEGKIYVATWISGDFAYAISSTDGLDQTHIENLVSEIQ